MEMRDALLEVADDNLVLGHRVSEWCGHAPLLEEDLAMPNMALDMIGTARSLYAYAAAVEGKGQSEDDLAYLRDERGYRNCLLVERPNGDFAHTMLKQLYFAAFMEPFWQAAQTSTDETIRGIAGKAAKEMSYHIRHAGEWVVRLGDGTDESMARMAEAVSDLEPYRGELFESSDAAQSVEKSGVFPKRASIKPVWTATINHVFAEAQLELPEEGYAQVGGRVGRHTEALGHMLAEMQSVYRAHPGASW